MRTVPSVAHHVVRQFGDATPSDVIRSPHGDCKLPDTTAAQRFFEMAGNRPDKVAMVTIYLF